MENDRDVFLISLFTFLTVSLWIFFELIKTTKTTTVPQTITKIIAPLTPSIDTDILEQLRARTTY